MHRSHRFHGKLNEKNLFMGLFKELTWSKLEQTCIFFVRVFSEIEPPNPSPLKSTRVDTEEANWPRAASRIPSHSFCTCYARYSSGSCTGRPYVWMVKMRSLFDHLYPLLILLLFWYWILILIFVGAKPAHWRRLRDLFICAWVCLCHVVFCERAWGWRWERKWERTCGRGRRCVSSRNRPYWILACRFVWFLFVLFWFQLFL